MLDLAQLQHRFYVYILLRPWNGVPCYVGKGQQKRVLDHEAAGERHTNKHLANVFKRAGGSLPFVILFSTDDEAEAFAWETRFILAIGRADLKLGPLCNKTNGGEGVSGWVPSEKDRLRMAAQPKAFFAALAEEERLAFSSKVSIGILRHLETLSEEDLRNRMIPAWKKWEQMTCEEQDAFMAPARAAARPALIAYFAAMSTEEKKAWGEKASADVSAFCATLTADQIKERMAPARAVFDNATPEELSALMAPAHAARDAYWASVSEEAKAAHMAKVMAGQNAYWERRRAEKARQELENEDGS